MIFNSPNGKRCTFFSNKEEWKKVKIWYMFLEITPLLKMFPLPKCIFIKFQQSPKQTFYQTSRPKRKNKCPKMVKVLQRTMWRLAEYTSKIFKSQYSRQHSIGREKNRPRERKSVFRGPALNIESWSRADQALWRTGRRVKPFNTWGKDQLSPNWKSTLYSLLSRGK